MLPLINLIEARRKMLNAEVIYFALWYKQKFGRVYYQTSKKHFKITCVYKDKSHFAQHESCHCTISKLQEILLFPWVCFSAAAPEPWHDLTFTQPQGSPCCLCYDMKWQKCEELMYRDSDCKRFFLVSCNCCVLSTCTLSTDQLYNLEFQPKFGIQFQIQWG